MVMGDASFVSAERDKKCCRLLKVLNERSTRFLKQVGVASDIAALPNGLKDKRLISDLIEVLQSFQVVKHRR